MKNQGNDVVAKDLGAHSKYQDHPKVKYYFNTKQMNILVFTGRLKIYIIKFFN